MTAERRYSGIAILNHWVAAVLVIVMMVLGLLAYFAPGDEVEDFVLEVHMALGFFVFLFVAWRVAYRLYVGFPPGKERTAPERWLAWIMHRALLLIIALLILTGPLYLFTEGEGVNVFGWFTVTIPLESLEVIHEPVEWIHVNLGLFGLPVLLGLHFLGALRHYVGGGGETPADL